MRRYKNHAIVLVLENIRYISYNEIVEQGGRSRSGTKLPPKQDVKGMKLEELKNELVNDPEFVKACEEIQPEMAVIQAIIDARISKGLTQQELSGRTGIAQTELSKLERGKRNPSIKLLQRLADGMDMVLRVSFVPKGQEGQNT